MEAGAFPKPMPLGEKAVGWLESEIKAWQEARCVLGKFRRRRDAYAAIIRNPSLSNLH